MQLVTSGGVSLGVRAAGLPPFNLQTGPGPVATDLPAQTPQGPTELRAARDVRTSAASAVRRKGRFGSFRAFGEAK